MMSQITPKPMLDNQIGLKHYKKVISIEIHPNSTYPLSEPSVLSVGDRYYWEPLVEKYQRASKNENFLLIKISQVA